MDDTSGSGILKPQPRRPGTFSLTPISTSTSASDLDHSPEYSTEPQTPDTADVGFGRKRSSDVNLSTGQNTPQTTRSFLNLTSSTLLGIYSPRGYESNRDEPATPWGAGTQTPARSTSIDLGRDIRSSLSAESAREKVEIGKERRRERSKSILQQRQGWAGRSAGARAVAIVMRTLLLFGFGLAYGQVIAHLHDTRNIAPVKVERINRGSWKYLAFWGVMGAVLGSLLPWVDGLMAHKQTESAVVDDDNDEKAGSSGADEGVGDSIQARLSLGAEWNPIVRSIGAFVGIAFAIRKLPWQSTLQVSLTLALVNPVIWYLIDRTSSGFLLSTTVGALGSAALLGINPGWIPSPATASSRPVASSSATWDFLRGGGNTAGAVQEDLFMGLVSYESIGVATWISSVLFCSCVFFGNIGRRLALERMPKP